MNKSVDVSLTFTNNNYLNNKRISNNLIKNRIISNLKKAENILSYDKFKDLQNDLILNLKDNKTIVANIINNNYKLEIIGGDSTFVDSKTPNSKPYIKSRNNSPQPNKINPTIPKSKNNLTSESIENPEDVTLGAKDEIPVTNSKLNKSTKNNSSFNKTSQTKPNLNKKINPSNLKYPIQTVVPSDSQLEETQPVTDEPDESLTKTTENPTTTETSVPTITQSVTDEPDESLTKITENPTTTETSVTTETSLPISTQSVMYEPKESLTKTTENPTTTETSVSPDTLVPTETSVPSDTQSVTDEPKESLTKTTETSGPEEQINKKEKNPETFLNKVYKFISGTSNPQQGGNKLNYLSDDDDDADDADDADDDDDYSVSNTLDTHTYFVDNNDDSDEEETLSDRMKDMINLNSLNIKKLREICKENNVQLTNNGSYLKKNDLIKQLQNKFVNS